MLNIVSQAGLGRMEVAHSEKYDLNCDFIWISIWIFLEVSECICNAQQRPLI